MCKSTAAATATPVEVAVVPVAGAAPASSQSTDILNLFDPGPAASSGSDASFTGGVSVAVAQPAAAPAPDVIEERMSKKHNRKYFYNRQTGKTGWSKARAKCPTPLRCTSSDTPCFAAGGSTDAKPRHSGDCGNSAWADVCSLPDDRR